MIVGSVKHLKARVTMRNRKMNKLINLYGHLTHDELQEKQSYYLSIGDIKNFRSISEFINNIVFVGVEVCSE